MSENLYPARLKRKRHSRAVVSNTQKRLLNALFSSISPKKMFRFAPKFSRQS